MFILIILSAHIVYILLIVYLISVQIANNLTCGVVIYFMLYRIELRLSEAGDVKRWIKGNFIQDSHVYTTVQLPPPDGTVHVELGFGSVRGSSER